MQTETINSAAPAASGNHRIAALAKTGEVPKANAQVKSEEIEVEMMYSDAEHANRA